MKKTARTRGLRLETAVKTVFGTIGPTGALPDDETAHKIYKYKEAEAENLEKSFRNCMEHANNTVEHVVLRAYQVLRSDAQNLSREVPLEAKALNSLANHIEEGFRSWFPLIAGSRKRTQNPLRG